VPLNTAAAVANNQDGRLEAVWLDGPKVMHAFQLAPNYGWSAQYELTTPLPGPPTGNPLIALDYRGVLVVVIDTGSGTVLTEQVQPNSSWTGWAMLGADMHRPALGSLLGPFVCPISSGDVWACSRGRGPLAVYYGEAFNGGWYYQQQEYEGVLWTPPRWWNADLFSGAGPVNAVVFNDGFNLDRYPPYNSEYVAYAGPTKSFVCPMPTISAGQCIDLGTPPGGFDLLASMSAGLNADGRAEVYAYGADDGVWHAYQLLDGSWTGWEPLFRPFTAARMVGAPQAQRNASGTMEVVMAANDGTVWHTFQVTPNGQWPGWYSLGPSGFTGSQAVAVAVNEDGRLEEFNVRPGPGAVVTHSYQQGPGTGPWSPIIPL